MQELFFIWQYGKTDEPTRLKPGVARSKYPECLKLRRKLINFSNVFVVISTVSWQNVEGRLKEWEVVRGAGSILSPDPKLCE